MQVRTEKNIYSVCRTFFETLFEINRRRVLLVARNINSGEEQTEKRGGNRWKDKLAAKKTSVEEFIGKFKACESHYNRSKSQRLYLPAELNISKMVKMYNDSTDSEKKVNYTYFHKIFSNNFNLGFGTPASDICSYCERQKNKIKIATGVEKQNRKRELKVHKLRAKQFHAIMKEEEEETASFCFDLQKVQNLPKLPIQEAYYSLQISFYSFCVVNQESKNPSFYTWTEDLSGRGSNEIGSALLHFLRNQSFENMSKIRLFADGCGGQNKNSHIVHLLMYWLYKESPPNISEILLTFPVHGHSYLPADRVFGRVERELRRHSKLVLP